MLAATVRANYRSVESRWASANTALVEAWF
jgi:hypothetical protein